LLIVSDDEYVFLTANVLPIVDSAAEVSIVFRYATGTELNEDIEPDGSLIALAPAPRADLDPNLDTTWKPLSEILAAFGAGDFDEETGTAVTLYAARTAGLGAETA
jgi:hypothetical protein